MDDDTLKELVVELLNRKRVDGEEPPPGDNSPTIQRLLSKNQTGKGCSLLKGRCSFFRFLGGKCRFVRLFLYFVLSELVGSVIGSIVGLRITFQLIIYANFLHQLGFGCRFRKYSEKFA